MYYGAGLGSCCLCTCTFTPLPTFCCMHASARCAPHAHACHCCPAVACGPSHAPLCQHASTTTGPVLHLCTAACPCTRISVHTLPVCTTTMCSDRELDSGSRVSMARDRGRGASAVGGSTGFARLPSHTTLPIHQFLVLFFCFFSTLTHSCTLTTAVCKVKGDPTGSNMHPIAHTKTVSQSSVSHVGGCVCF